MSPYACPVTLRPCCHPERSEGPPRAFLRYHGPVTLTETLHDATARLRAALDDVTRLRAAAIDDARLEAELLLRHALGLSREALLARLREPLPADARTAFESLLRRRLAREPTAYIVGHKEFYGLNLICTPAALIPGPRLSCWWTRPSIGFRDGPLVPRPPTLDPSSRTSARGTALSL